MKTPSPASPAPSPLTRWLKKAPTSLFVLYAGTAGFATYFTMYAFRKPFLAMSYDGLSLGGLDLKTMLVVSQLAGYTLSKYVGIKVCSETRRQHRLPILLGLMTASEFALLLFAVLPVHLKLMAIFLNGFPLGMVWGICVLYLEGRRTTEVLLAGLSASYIISSGAFKDIGRAVLDTGRVGDFWMPCVTGLCFLPVFALAAWLLNQLPDPSEADELQRSHREPMCKEERRRFLHCFARGIVLQLLLYIALTAFRDFRDNFGLEIFRGLGLGDTHAIFSRTESWVALAALVALSSLRIFDAKRWGVLPNMIYMIIGTAIIGTSTVLFDLGLIDGKAWMILVGTGSYLAYVANDTVFYERVLAGSHWAGTAVFMTYVMDAGGYTGSVALQLYKNIGSDNLSYFRFFHHMAYALTGLSLILLAHNIFYFLPKNLCLKMTTERPEK